jgi:hypothetical protein
MYILFFMQGTVHNEGNVSNEQVSQPNASGPSNVRAYFANFFFIILNCNEELIVYITSQPSHSIYFI